MDTDKTEYKVAGKGVLKAFWFGLVAFIVILIINEFSPYNNSGEGGALSRGLNMVFTVFIAGIYCFFGFIITLCELADNRKQSNVDTTRAMLALTLYGIVVLIVGFLTFTFL